jgi:hypothetical protein
MPVFKCSNGKYRIGGGPCMYKSKASAERAWEGYKKSGGGTGKTKKRSRKKSRKKRRS